MAPVIPLIVIVGPTASGKTSLGVKLAKQFNGEVICADSRTVYKGLDVGTAKPTTHEQAGIVHHMLDVVSPNEQFTAADFKTSANQLINDIASKHKVPFMVGGSGLYIDSVLFDYKFSPANALKDKTNPRHLDQSVPKQRGSLRNNTLVIGITKDNAALKQAIQERIEVMLQNGLVDEVKSVMEKYPTSKALHAPGYKAVTSYVNGALTLDEAKQEFVRNDYQLAKRQKTWFKRNKSIQWVHEQSEAIASVKAFLDKQS